MRRTGFCGNLSHEEVSALTAAGVSRQEIARRCDVTPEHITHLRKYLGISLPRDGARPNTGPKPKRRTLQGAW